MRFMLQWRHEVRRQNMMDRRIVSIIRSLRPSGFEDWCVLIFALSTFVGIGYALPMLNVIKDATGFSGGVLRSIEAHTLLPGIVPYGTVTFYLCYASIVAFLAVALPFYHFSIEAMRGGLLEHPEQIYLISRAVSAAGIAVLILYTHRFLKREVSDPLYRIAIIITVFGNILATTLSRSGKVWVLSAAFGTAAIIACCESIRDERVPGKRAALSIYLAALAAANFVLATLYGVVILILAYFFRGPVARKKIAVYTLGAIVLGAFITALNFQNLYNLVVEIFTGYHPLFAAQSTAHVDVPFLTSVWIKLIQVAEAYPLVLILTILALVRGISQRRLLGVGILVALLYFVLISFIASWYSDVNSYLRYLYPLGFLFIPIVAALKPPHKVVLLILITLNTVIYLHTVVLLWTPATYNIAEQRIIERFGSENLVIENHIFELDLPMNKRSYRLLDPKNCATKCQYALAAGDDNAFRPVVETIYSTMSTSSSRRIVVSETPLSSCGEPLIAIPGPLTRSYVDIEYGLGNYFNPAFYSTTNLGKHIFLYERALCPVLTIPENTPKANTL